MATKLDVRGSLASLAATLMGRSTIIGDFDLMARWSAVQLRASAVGLDMERWDRLAPQSPNYDPVIAELDAAARIVGLARWVDHQSVERAITASEAAVIRVDRLLG